MKILVTGACGFVGANTMSVLLDQGFDMTGTDFEPAVRLRKDILESLGCGSVSIAIADLTEVESWKKLLIEIKPDVILHLAGFTSRGNSPDAWKKCWESNPCTVASFIEAAVNFPEDERPAFICPGTQMEYGTAPMPWKESSACFPSSAYGASKLASTVLVEAAVRSGILKGCVLRFPLLFGRGQAPTMFVPELLVRALRGEPFKMTEGRQKRRYIFVEDAAKQMLEIASRLTEGETLPAIINAPSLTPVRMVDVAHRIVESVGSDISLGIGELPGRSGELEEAWPDDSLARELGFRTYTSFEEALTKTVSWYRQNFSR